MHVNTNECNNKLVKYLKKTREYGLILRPDRDKSLECYVDADFCEIWNKLTAEKDPITAMSGTGYVVTFMGCTIAWSLKLETQIALSTMEAK